MKEEHRNGDKFDFLIGKSIEKVNYIGGKGYEAGKWELICKDNTKIIVEENAGCGGCGNGWSSIDLKCLENNHNVITNVITEYEFDIAQRHKDNIKNFDIWDYDEDDRFKIFVYYKDSLWNRNSREVIQGEDGYGNGYYGGGFYITIKSVEREE